MLWPLTKSRDSAPARFTPPIQRGSDISPRRRREAGPLFRLGRVKLTPPAYAELI